MRLFSSLSKDPEYYHREAEHVRARYREAFLEKQRLEAEIGLQQRGLQLQQQMQQQQQQQQQKPVVSVSGAGGLVAVSPGDGGVAAGKEDGKRKVKKKRIDFSGGFSP